MENWANLNKVLVLEQKEVSIKDELGKKMIEASFANNKELAKTLLKNGAILNFNEEHFTPLIACIENNFLDLADFYIKAKASITYRPNSVFIDALWYSVINKKHDFLKLFINNYCLLPRHPENNQTLLTYATVNSDLKAVEYLLSHYKINVNEKDGNGNTALHYNIAKMTPSSEDILIGKMLLAAGADSNLPNMDGKTPSDLATDSAARSLLLSNELENKLEEKEDIMVENENKLSPVIRLKNNKIKI